MNYKLAAKILYSFFYSNNEIHNYKAVIRSLIKFFISLDTYVSRNSKINFEFNKVDDSQKSEIEDILELEENPNLVKVKGVTLPTMHIYNDGEIHFDDYIYTDKDSDEVFLNKDIDEIILCSPSQNINLVKKDVPWTIDKLVIAQEFANIGYGDYKTRVLPGDWIIITNNENHLYNYSRKERENLYGYRNESEIRIYPETLFSKEQLECAAEWWANYLPGIKKITFDQINQKAKLPSYGKVMNRFFKIAHEEVVTKEQYRDFVKILIKEMQSLEVQSRFDYPYYIELDSGHHPCESLVKALESIGVCPSLIFPLRSCMRIYNIGQTNVNNEVIYQSSNLNLYTHKNLDFEYAPLMIFKGGKFRLLEIKIDDLNAPLYCISSSGVIIYDIKAYLKFCKSTYNPDYVSFETLYLSIKKKYFKNSSKVPEDFTSKELIKILQNPDSIRETFEQNIRINYEIIMKNVVNAKTHIFGKVTPKHMGESWYEYYTNPVNVVKITKDGTINDDGPEFVKAGDLIMVQPGKKSLKHYPQEFKSSGYAGYLCDSHGDIIDPVTPYYPGDPLVPLIAIDVHVTSLNF